eukprot:sb/3466470/
MCSLSPSLSLSLSFSLSLSSIYLSLSLSLSPSRAIVNKDDDNWWQAVKVQSDGETEKPKQAGYSHVLNKVVACHVEGNTVTGYMMGGCVVSLSIYLSLSLSLSPSRAIVNKDDDNWWQAVKVQSDGETEKPKQAGCPQCRGNCVTKSFSPQIKKAKTMKKRKIMYSAQKNAEYDRHSIPIYEELARMPPFQRKTMVLVGSDSAGRDSLVSKLLTKDSERFGKYLEFGEYEGNLYGTKLDSVRAVMRSGKTSVLSIHPQSLKTVRLLPEEGQYYRAGSSSIFLGGCSGRRPLFTNSRTCDRSARRARRELRPGGFGGQSPPTRVQGRLNQANFRVFNHL